MKVLQEHNFEDGTKITMYEGSDITKPHCGEYCIMDHSVGSGCKFCGKSFGDSFTEEEVAGNYLKNLIAKTKTKTELDQFF